MGVFKEINYIFFFRPLIGSAQEVILLAENGWL